jgi:hypothetical protein
MSIPNEYCGSTPIPTIYTASNINNDGGDLSKEEVMRANYISRLKKIMYDFNLQGQSAGGANYVYPDYKQGEKTKPRYISQYNTISNVYKKYDIKPCFL